MMLKKCRSILFDKTKVIYKWTAAINGDQPEGVFV
jgi:hypothetical protein